MQKASLGLKFGVAGVPLKAALKDTRSVSNLQGCTVQVPRLESSFLSSYCICLQSLYNSIIWYSLT